MDSDALPDSALPPPYLGGDAWQWERGNKAFAKTSTRFLLSLAGSERTLSRESRVAVVKPGEAGEPAWRFATPPVWGEIPAGAGETRTTNSVVAYWDSSSGWFFPLWDSEETHRAIFDASSGEKLMEDVSSESSFLFFLWDNKLEDDSRGGHHYERTRVLWHLYHDEELDGDRSIDIFPGIGIDNKKNGYHKTSVLWRLFRYEDDPDKGVSLDLLFIPILRP